MNELTTIFLAWALWSSYYQILGIQKIALTWKMCITPYYHLAVPLAKYAEAGTAHLKVDSSSELHQSWFKMQFSIRTE